VEAFFDFKETHLRVSADKVDEGRVRAHLAKIYDELESYVGRNVFFATTLEPVEAGPKAPEIAVKMSAAARAAGVGPMAAVAGAFAQEVGEFILKGGAREVVVENGGDIYIKALTEKVVGLHAGEGKLSNKLALKLKPAETPCGVCTSSGTLGHSISFGEADAVAVVADSAFLADAAATTIANEVRGKDAVQKGLAKAREINGIRGVLIVKDDDLAAWGKLPEIIQA
jgi:ApbE superfamily uncharacterized protein (UPF0280 family)